MSLKLYGHYISQPSRAVLWTLAIKKLPFQFVKLDPTAGEADTDAYYAKFPQGGVPAIEEPDGFRLTEVGAILPYLAAKNGWTDLYPTDLRQRAQVDQWLHWNHTNTRLFTNYFFRPRMLAAAGIKSKKDPAELEKLGAKALRDVIAVMTHGALKHHTYLVGDAVTLADIVTYCEIDQLVALKICDFVAHPEMREWLQRMQKLPEHDNVRRSLFKLAEKINASKL